MANRLIDIEQFIMGRLAGGYHDNFLPNLPSNGNGSGSSNRALHVFDCAEYYSILFCSHYGFAVPLLLDTQGPESAFDIPKQPDTLSAHPSQHLLISGISVWLCQPRSHRLSDIHTREIL